MRSSPLFIVRRLSVRLRGLAAREVARVLDAPVDASVLGSDEARDEDTRGHQAEELDLVDILVERRAVDDVVGGGGGNNGGGNGGNTGGDTDGETDPDKYTDSNSDGNTTYYISFSDGDDSKDGKSEANAFKNLGKINSITFAPGDKIKFKSGDTWKGYFKIRGSGSSSNPILIESYGSASRPIIDGNGYQASLFLENVEYIEDKNLEFINEASHKKSDGSDKLMNGSTRSGQDERFGILALRFSAGKNINHLKFSDIKISNIISAVDEEVKMLNCKKESKKGCNNKSTKCITHNLWDQLDKHINNFFEKVKLQDLVKRNSNL